MSLEDWELYVGIKRVRAWGPDEEEFVSSLPPDEQDLIYELAVRLNVELVELDRAGVGTPGPTTRRPGQLVTRTPPGQLSL